MLNMYSILIYYGWIIVFLKNSVDIFAIVCSCAFPAVLPSSPFRTQQPQALCKLESSTMPLGLAQCWEFNSRMMFVTLVKHTKRLCHCMI